MNAQNAVASLVGDSRAMVTLRSSILQLATSDISVLITGESGVGKEVIARAIHNASGAYGEFVPVNCGALAPELIASELFGHERGSFSGAQRRHVGVFERAEGGTLFLDEVTEMPLSQQPHLLRALESGRITRVGAEQEVAYDARVIAAFNIEPKEALHRGCLRRDLFYRLSVFPIHVPPLRTRREDIPSLANLFLDRLNEEHGRVLCLSNEQLDMLKAWTWPGNVRELKHTVQRAFVCTRKGGNLELADPAVTNMRPVRKNQDLVGQSIHDVERKLIFATLEYHCGNKTEAAESLGISPKTLYNRIVSYRSNAESVSST